VKTTVELFAGSAAEWDAYVEQHPAATASHLYTWKPVIERAYRHECPYLVARRGNEIVGVLPLVYVRSAAFGKYLVSMPYLNAGGPLGDAEACDALNLAAVALAKERNASVVEYRCTSESSLEMDYTIDKVACVMPLPETSEQLWKNFPAKLRSQVRRPQKEGITAKFGTDQIDAFFGVFARNMRDLGSPTHSKHFFRILAEEFGAHVWFVAAYKDATPVAAGCAIQWRGEVEMTWASALREFNSMSPNMLIYSAVMERGVAEGLTRFNFGRCTPDTGSHRFKKQWGSTDVPLYWYRWSKDSAHALPGTGGGAMSVATRLWRHMPVQIATLIGPQLRRGIPA
jgi:serine/alanine adding enzyme